MGVVASFVLWHRLLGYLRYFQQEGYDVLRFLGWTRWRPLTDPAFLLGLASWLFAMRWPRSAAVAFVVGGLVAVAAQPDPRRSGKLPLRLTWRARRLLAAAFVLGVACWLGLLAAGRSHLLPGSLIASMAVFVMVPVFLVVANGALSPLERHVQKGYERDARQRLTAVQPFIVGITGSYGKSSTKAMLAHILQFKGPTLSAAGSVNTFMGITRHLRENLRGGFEFMVVEMGAYRPGSIRRLCGLTPPQAGIITAVGDMHLERFGSTDEIIKAKSELAQCLAPGGLLVVNADSPGALRIAQTVHGPRVLLYGMRSTLELTTRLIEPRSIKGGTSFGIHTNTGRYECWTPLLGEPIILNLVGAFTLAIAMGMAPELVVAAMTTLRPVSNRLEVVEDDGVTWVRDAYNSNQFGFRAALKVAADLPATRRVLVTPGVIELGDAQFDVNRALSREAAESCDVTLVVSDANRAAFSAGHRDAGQEERLVPMDDRSAAFRWLKEMLRPGDLVILENDLPDLYEPSGALFWRGRK